MLVQQIGTLHSELRTERATAELWWKSNFKYEMSNQRITLMVLVEQIQVQLQRSLL